MPKTIKPITAYAVVNKNKPKLSVLEVYPDKNVNLRADEKIIQIVIKTK